MVCLKVGLSILARPTQGDGSLAIRQKREQQLRRNPLVPFDLPPATVLAFSELLQGGVKR
jgi:hypothetical protein